LTALAALIAARIRATGPITVAEFMADCLLHPIHGYYATRDPLGAAGDFTTAPEISQMFGELLGLCLAQAWIDQGSPAPFVLAELGPGRGTLMADVLRATQGVPGFHGSMSVHLVEASPVLRARQAERLGASRVTWHDRIDTLPDASLFLLANEFFDALPVRQFVRAGAGWRERVVGIADDGLAFGLTDAVPFAALRNRLGDTAEGDVVEVCPAASPIAAAIGARIAARGGAAVIVDYGGWRSRGDTLQAVRGHAYCDPLTSPGEADLTAHVDFAVLSAAANPAAATRLIAQGALLNRLGIAQRAARLAAGLTGAALDSHIAAHRRLTDPDLMGTVFQALALYPQGGPVPPGFDP